MKKLLIILSILIGSIVVNGESLTVINNTSTTIYYSILAHNATYSSCSDLISTNHYPVGGGGGSNFLPMASSIGSAYYGSSYPTSFVVGITGVFDGIKFTAEDGVDCFEYGAIGACGGLPTSFTGSCHFCGQNALTVSWVTFLGDITVTFNN